MQCRQRCRSHPLMQPVDLFINSAIKGHTQRCVRVDVGYLDLKKQMPKSCRLSSSLAGFALSRQSGTDWNCNAGAEKKNCMTSCIKLSDWNQASFIIIKNKPDTNRISEQRKCVVCCHLAGFPSPSPSFDFILFDSSEPRQTLDCLL